MRELFMIELNISDNLTYNFKKHNIPFSHIGSFIKKYCYSASCYKTGHRHKDNIISLGNVLIYDFDDGSIPLPAMKQFMEKNKITSAIFTTKSHQKEKNGKPAVDRYRLFIPFSKNFTVSVEEYSYLFMYVAELLNIQNAIDTACKNPSRSFYPNPEQEEYYIEAGRIFNTDYIETQFFQYNKRNNVEIKAETEKVNKPKPKKQTANSYSKLKDNEVSGDTDIECNHGVIYPLNHFEYLQGDETVPCRCINPFHEDRNPSAFVGRSKGSGRLMVKCSSCGAVYFMR